MSVLIKGMAMPMSCYECHYSDEDENECEINLCKCEWGHNRPDDCPMVEVETPHGRLIDASALLWKEGQMAVIQDAAYGRGREEMKNAIRTAPTVIEAEES